MHTALMNMHWRTSVKNVYKHARTHTHKIVFKRLLLSPASVRGQLITHLLHLVLIFHNSLETRNIYRDIQSELLAFNY